jgi:type II secretory pathway pseudopilin PulG
MFGILKRNNGITLIELIVVLIISTVLIMVSAIGVSVFYRRYKVVSDYTSLQTQAMAALQTIRNGHGFGRGEEFYGVANARSLQILGGTDVFGGGSGIRILPPAARDYQANDWVEFYLDGTAIRMNYVYNGVQVDTPQYIFPTRDQLDKIQVTRFEVYDANGTGSILPIESLSVEDRPALLRVELDARVKIRDGIHPKPDEYKTISYSTYMVKK